jgi:hypothetical protein
MKKINLSMTMYKINIICYSIKSLILNEDGSYDCNSSFKVIEELTLNG